LVNTSNQTPIQLGEGAGGAILWPSCLIIMSKEAIPIYVIVEHGRVWEIKNIPDGLQIQVIDKDVEGEEENTLQVSPLDGDACTIQTFGPV
jgi:hypothetical protein